MGQTTRAAYIYPFLSSGLFGCNCGESMESRSVGFVGFFFFPVLRSWSFFGLLFFEFFKKLSVHMLFK